MEARVLGARAGLIALAACGRIGFGGGADASGTGDGAPIDVPVQTADTPVGAVCGTDLECGRCARCEGTCSIEPIADVFLGHRSTCYTGPDGTRWCAGDNTDGVLGLGDVIDRATPERDPDPGWTKIWMFYYGASYGVRGGNLYTWGPSETPAPVIVGDAAQIREFLGDTRPMCEWHVDGSADCDPTGQTWISLAAGSDHFCGVKSDQSLWCWGTNNDGSLGQAGFAEGQVAMNPVRVATGTNWAEVGVGSNLDNFFSCARTTTGEVYCWGHPDYTGTNGVDAAEVPTMVFDGAVSLEVDWEHSCARRATGDVFCWGRDTYGGWVLPGIQNAMIPTLVPAGPYDRFVIGGHHTCLLEPGGRWRCFGWNTSGQLANGTTTNDGTFVDLCP